MQSNRSCNKVKRPRSQRNRSRRVIISIAAISWWGRFTSIAQGGSVNRLGTPVFINAQGRLGTATSSARFKDEIKPMGEVSEAILALKPVTFHYKKELDPDGTPQFGFVAEDVAKVKSASAFLIHSAVSARIED